MAAQRTFPLWVLIALLVAGGCATARSDVGVEGEATADERVCVRVREIHDYEAIDEYNVVVEARHDRYYLFTFDQRCGGITFATGITIADRATRVCSDGGHWLTFGHVGGPKRCLVANIEQVEDVDAARELVASREESWMD